MHDKARWVTTRRPLQSNCNTEAQPILRFRLRKESYLSDIGPYLDNRAHFIDRYISIANYKGHLTLNLSRPSSMLFGVEQRR